MPSVTTSTPKRNSISLPVAPMEDSTTASIAGRRRGSNDKPHKLAKLLRKNQSKDRKQGQNDDWLDLNGVDDTPFEDTMEFIQPVEPKKTRRSIVRKTSKMFSRAQPDDILSPASHPPALTSRNPSSSSSHLRRPSLDSHSSSSTSLSVPNPMSGSRRPLSSTTFDSLESTSPQTSMSASVPSLSTRQLPQPSRASQPPAQQDISSRMSSWFSHLLTSPTDPPSPNRKQPSTAATFLNAARQKAAGGMRYLMDSDAQPDKSEETFWVMGVPHEGYRPPPPPPGMADSVETIVPSTTPNKFGSLFSSSTLTLGVPASGGSPVKGATLNGEAQNPSPSKAGRARKEKEVVKWPEEFLADLQSTIWCSYRSQYAPIAALAQTELIPTAEAYYAAYGQLPPVAPVPPKEGLTTDAGWGCMLRTGQSMLANALIHLHLGRNWRVPTSRPTADVELVAYGKYVQIISWFLDDPSPLCPFAVHRMALIGKQLGKEVGEWFGPSTAAGALKTLTNAFTPSGLAVAPASDGTVYKSQVYEASGGNSAKWGDKAVLVLVNVRLGLDGVNPLYHDSVKALFTFPQSVGIAGGRPSSSYYFVASQGNSLFYLDPHFTRPAIPLEIPPADLAPASGSRDIDTETMELIPAATVTPSEDGSIDPEPRWYAEAYADQHLRSYHSERVKKMPLSGLDPSMLLGFLCRDGADFSDFAHRVVTLPQKIFAVQGEPTNWDFDDDPGLESFSEPDDCADNDKADEPEMGNDDDEDEDEDEDGDLVPSFPGPAPVDMARPKEPERPPPLMSVGSWVEPPRGGAAAPNGSAEDDVFVTPRK